MNLSDGIAKAFASLEKGRVADAPEADEAPAAPAAPAPPALHPTVHKQPEHGQHIGGARLPAPGTTVDVTAPPPLKRSDDPDTHVIGPTGRPFPGHWENRYRPPVDNCQHPELLAIENRTTRELVGKLCDTCGTRLAPNWTPPPAPDWWSTKAPEGACQHPKLQPVRIKTGELVAYWCPDCEVQFDTPYTEPGYHDLDDRDEDEGTGGDSDEEQVSAGVRARLAAWTTGGKGRAPIPRPANAAPARPEGTGYRTSFTEWRAGVDPRWKALAQNGAGLGVGWYLGVPQFIARETAYLVEHCDGFTDSMALTGYVPAVIILWFDRRTHRARAFLAYPARALTVCLIVGVFCQGIAQHL